MKETKMCQCLNASTKHHLCNKPLHLADIQQAAIRISPYIRRTPCEFNERLSFELGQKLYLKREDQQEIRSFKVRGAVNKLLTLTKNEKKRGVICASAGNHAQGIAFSSCLLNIHCVVLLPKNTPKQKVKQVQYFGKAYVKVILMGKNFDETCNLAKEMAKKTGQVFVHPFDDMDVISGQGTLALEIVSDLSDSLDYLFVPVGGGGLISGVSKVFKALSPATQVIGVEVEGSDAMAKSLARSERVTLNELDTFADGTAVCEVGEHTFSLAQDLVDDVVVLTKAEVCETVFDMNNAHGIIVEPSGALAIAGAKKIRGKGHKVGCILSGANNDASRFSEFLSFMGNKKPA
jgi:threonine dehydratase